jgi:transposase, IS5 family
MRHSEQLPLTAPWIGHEHARELATISTLLDSQPRIAALVQQDLLRGLKQPTTGAPGLSGDQVVRIAVVKQMHGWSYAALAFHLSDSASYRTFCRVGALEESPARSTVAANLRKLRPATLAAINRLVIAGADRRKIEPGRTVRIDSTVVEAAIHAPTDSGLLVDGVRVLQRLLRRAERLAGFTGYHRHLKRAKRRLLEIQQAKPQATRQRRAAYRDLLAVVRQTVSYAERALAAVAALGEPDTRALHTLRQQLASILPLVRRVIQQTERRVLSGQQVPATEKLVSLFEPHSDVILKDSRETLYGHKIFLTGGRSGLILDCTVVKGNPADASWAVPLLKRHAAHYGRAPRQASFDGSFASTENLRAAKALGVEDVCFAKRRNLAISDMVKSNWVYHRLRRFRAGIESAISLLKRVFGLSRCTWKGAKGFVTYVRTAVLAANLVTLARHLLA